MKAEVVAVWLFEAGDESTKDAPLRRAEPNGLPMELWATLTPAEQAVSVAFARRAYTAGLRRAQEMAEDYGGIDFDDIGFDRAIDAEVAKGRE